jgi:hypothetical protein
MRFARSTRCIRATARLPTPSNSLDSLQFLSFFYKSGLASALSQTAGKPSARWLALGFLYDRLGYLLTTTTSKALGAVAVAQQHILAPLTAPCGRRSHPRVSLPAVAPTLAILERGAKRPVREGVGWGGVRLRFRCLVESKGEGGVAACGRHVIGGRLRRPPGRQSTNPQAPRERSDRGAQRGSRESSRPRASEVAVVLFE